MHKKEEVVNRNESCSEIEGTIDTVETGVFFRHVCLGYSVHVAPGASDICHRCSSFFYSPPFLIFRIHS